MAESMKKYLLVAVMAILPLMTVTPVMAAPLYNGSVTLDFTSVGSGATTLDWAVYAPGETGALAGVSPTDYTYQYTMHGWSGYTTSILTDIGKIINPAASLGSGKVGNTQIVSVVDSPVSDLYKGYAFFFDTYRIRGVNDFTNPLATTTGWYTSSFGPVNTWISATLTGVGGQTFGAGLGFDSQTIMGAGIVPILPPGVPEPPTWALLLCLMAFTTLWMLCSSDDDDAALQMTPVFA